MLCKAKGLKEGWGPNREQPLQEQQEVKDDKGEGEGGLGGGAASDA